MRAYHYCGLELHSHWPIPEMPAASRTRLPDLTVTRGDREMRRQLAQLPRVRQAMKLPAGEGFVSLIPGVGGMRVTPGLIEVVLEQTGTWASMRPFVLGTGFAIAMYQFGLIPHHVSAVSIGGRAIAFTGPSGAGKSTAAGAMMSRHGAGLVCDDVARTRISPEGNAEVFAGLHRIKLCTDSVEALGLRASARTRDDEGEKHLMPRSRHGVGGSLPLAALIVLGSGFADDRAQVHRLQAIEALQEWFASIYREDIGSSMLSRGAMLTHCASLVKGVPVFRLAQTRDLSRIHEGLQVLMRRLVDEKCLSAVA